MRGEEASPAVRLLPEAREDLPDIDRARPRLAVAATIAAASALVPAMVFLAPESVWQPQDLFTVLLCFGFVSFAAAVTLRRMTLDAGFAIALISLVFLGPLPAALAFSAPELARWLAGHPTVRFLANIASFGWSVLAASLVLDALEGTAPPDLDAAAYGAIALAGVVLALVNFAIGMVLIDVLLLGVRSHMMVRQELIPSSPVDAVLICASLLTVFLYDQIGIVGLAPIALMLLVPRLLTPLLVKRQMAAQVPRSTATAVYAEAIADELGLDRGRKRVLADAASHLGGDATLTRLEDFTAVMEAVLHHRERWDGEDGGAPGVAAGADIPLESRVLAVANAWSELTAEGTRGLSPEEALHDLRARAGTEFDPEIVAAAVLCVRNRSLHFAP